MNKFIVILLAALVLALPAASKKRHYSKVKNHPITMIDKDTTGVVAYSDTTSLANDSLALDSLAKRSSYSRTVHYTFNDQDLSVLMEPLKALIGIGVVGVFIAIIAIVAIIFFSILPFVFFGLVVYLIVKHHNDKQKLARAALMSGRPIPQNLVKESVETDDEMWRRGLKNVFLGLGIAVLCYCLGAKALAGIGWLILICGVGQAIIAKTSSKKSNKPVAEEESQTPDIHNQTPGPGTPPPPPADEG